MENIILNILLEDDGINFNVVGSIVNNLVRPLDFLEIEERHQQVHRDNYYEEIISSFSDLQFYEHFGMYPETAEELVQILGNTLPNPDKLAPLRKKVLFSVWILSKQESFLATSDRFNLPVSTGHTIFKEIITTIAYLLPQYIVWPDVNTFEATAAIFQLRSGGFPGIIGAIDACHISCKKPIGNAVDYFNKKGCHSIILQGTCDHKGKFIDVYIGSPGRMHNGKVFKNSPLFQRMAEVDFIPQNFHLLGDVTYPLKKNLMTPFKNTEHLTAAETIYNTKLSTVRSTIEGAFERLKGKFKRLKYLDISDFDLGNSMIAAACVLHNFILDRNYVGVEDEEKNEDLNQDQDAVENDVIYHFEEEVFVEMDAIQKRNTIVSMF